MNQLGWRNRARGKRFHRVKGWRRKIRPFAADQTGIWGGVTTAYKHHRTQIPKGWGNGSVLCLTGWRWLLATNPRLLQFSLIQVGHHQQGIRKYFGISDSDQPTVKTSVAGTSWALVWPLRAPLQSGFPCLPHCLGFLSSLWVFCLYTTDFFFFGTISLLLS